MLKMPERQPGDGPVGVNRLDGACIGIEATTDGETQGISMSEYNAWRVLGLLSVFLQVPLSAAANKAVKLGEKKQDLTMTIGPSNPLVSLGDKLAHNLHMRVMQRELAKEGLVVEPVESKKKPKKKK